MIGPVPERESSYLGAFLPSNISHLLFVQLDISNRFSLFVRGGIPVVAEHGGRCVDGVWGEREAHMYVCKCVNTSYCCTNPCLQNASLTQERHINNEQPLLSWGILRGKRKEREVEGQMGYYSVGM
jgi:hypothetical protein